MEPDFHKNEAQARILHAKAGRESRPKHEGTNQQEATNNCSPTGTIFLYKNTQSNPESNSSHVAKKEWSDGCKATNQSLGTPSTEGVQQETDPDEDKCILFGKIRNGCDINLKPKESDNSLCQILQNMNVELAPSAPNCILGKKNDNSLQDVSSQSKEMSSLNSFPSVISNVSQCENRLISEGEQFDMLSKKDNDISYTSNDCCNVLMQNATTLTTQPALSLACQTQNIPITSLACITPKDLPNRVLQHQPQCHLKNDVTGTVSSSECTNYLSAPLSRSQRQSLFSKSQSFDIGEDLPSNSYTEKDDHVYSQLSDINEDIQQQHRIEYLERSEEEHDKNCQVEREDAWNMSAYTTQKTGMLSKPQSLDSRPIYPNVPFSPYASPFSSPRTNRRRPPLRESRRVSIEQSGSFLQLNQYKLLDQIGQGSYGLVKLAYSEEDSTHYAMKILSKRRLLRQAGLLKRGPKKGTSPLDRVYREIAVLKKLDHPNVVKLVEVLDDPLEDSLYMVFELVKKGEVLTIPTKNPLTFERAWSVFRDTLLGLEYLHYQRIIHADIKPGNLLLTECGRVKIADLGVCNEFIGEDSTMTNYSTAGTPAFRAPETLNVGQNVYCGKAADIWALGATLYALVFGNVPFVAASVPVLYDRIKNKPLSFPENSKPCPDLKDCIERMLTKNPETRITLPQLKVHPWVEVSGMHPLPSEEENCRLVQVDDCDINSVVRSIPKLDTLILIKTMLKQHSFGNPFSRGVSGRAPQRGGSRLERFVRAGRSNSAPGSYNNIEDRQICVDNILPALSEYSASNGTNEEH
ncbi:calcium/calmodulin-dependent protein kinase kinase 1 isoform X1 [Stomoxys calcitrans]|uniref:calcium/calmodulin-dependent protein kinase n=1 Tax=Stomoxys calcitrans TaxID=35570 RepID=A0A1I8NX18_STOCA|nr:calcium/calmodulin-dependent protein kinase kinase 1 isoform X1 [Stomoxys calcitrans]